MTATVCVVSRLYGKRTFHRVGAVAYRRNQTLMLWQGACGVCGETFQVATSQREATQGLQTFCCPAHRPLSPTGQKYFEYLREISETSGTTLEDWRRACTIRGLIDPQASPGSARAQFSKYKRELISKNRITCQGTTARILHTAD